MTIRNPMFGVGDVIRDHAERIGRLERALGLYEMGEALRMVGTSANPNICDGPTPPDTCGECPRCRGIDHDDAAALMAELVLLTDDERGRIERSLAACGVCGCDGHVVRLDHSTPGTEACDMWEA